MTTIATAVFAHQGGWDEALLIGGPMLGIAALLIIAKRRVDAAADASERPALDGRSDAAKPTD